MSPVDQNLIIMDVLKKKADKHGMACLLHEKPFQGVNGSGKHNNWSLVTDDGQNLLEPGTARMKIFVSCCLSVQYRGCGYISGAASYGGKLLRE